MTDLDWTARSAPADAETEVRACFAAYEDALIAGDVVAMNEWFADDTRTVRFGIADEQWGADAVRHWRRTASKVPPGRELTDTNVSVWTPDVAVITTLFSYPDSPARGRQSQLWIRTEVGWRIVHAHVSERPGE